MNRGIATLIGFILLALGLLSIILKMVGVEFSFLLWMDAWGAGVGFVLKLLMIVLGIMVMYFAQGGLKSPD